MSKASTSKQLGHKKVETKGVIDNGKGSNVSNCLSELNIITFGFWCKQLTIYPYWNVLVFPCLLDRMYIRKLNTTEDLKYYNNLKHFFILWW
jgi:hypothetical protein